jgi:hypothetical protein
MKNKHRGGGREEFCLEILEEGDTFFSLNFWDYPHRPRCRIHLQNTRKKIVHTLQVFFVFHVIWREIEIDTVINTEALLRYNLIFIFARIRTDSPLSVPQRSAGSVAFCFFMCLVFRFLFQSTYDIVAIQEIILKVMRTKK